LNEEEIEIIEKLKQAYDLTYKKSLTVMPASSKSNYLSSSFLKFLNHQEANPSKLEVLLPFIPLTQNLYLYLKNRYALLEVPTISALFSPSMSLIGFNVAHHLKI
jgi:hypothetical protein